MYLLINSSGTLEKRFIIIYIFLIIDIVTSNNDALIFSFKFLPTLHVVECSCTDQQLVLVLVLVLPPPHVLPDKTTRSAKSTPW